MKHNVVAPSVGESITEVSILKWAKPSGQAVKAGDLLLEIESDKATVEIVAEKSGVLEHLKPAGERIPIGEIIGMIDDAGTPASASQAASATPAATAPPPFGQGSGAVSAGTPTTNVANHVSGPAARKIAAEQGVDLSKVSGTGKDGRVTKGDLINGGTQAAASPSRPAPVSSAPVSAPQPTQQISSIPLREGDRRVPMSMLRAKIAERLVQAQHTAAILTTFNEVDMSAVMQYRNKEKDAFKAKHGVALSFMSFFTRASIAALKAVPEVNATIDGRDIIYHDYYDIGIAVGTERGLVVPVVRGADQMDTVAIEKKIAELALKARDGKLGIQDMTGGTFTISNGGTYGSLLSTPILNPPQSGILGMHKIQDRPMAVNGKVEVRPMMYLALSYDHRLIDGKGAVTFLVTLKEFLESPEKIRI